MNIFKINSQGLIKSEIDEDVFNSTISGEDRIFSMQRFADTYSLRQSSTGNGASNFSTTFISPSSLTGVLSAYTLGRSSEQSLANVSVYNDSNITSSHITIAPLVSSESGIVQYYDPSYKLTAYQINASDIRIAIAYNNLPVQTSTGGAGVDYFVGFAVDSSLYKAYAHGTFNGSDYSSSSGIFYTNGSYTSVYPTGVEFSSTYLMMSAHDAQGKSFGNGNTVWISDTGKRYSVDLYDVSLAASNTNTPDDLKSLITGKYVYRDNSAAASQKSIDFVNDGNLVQFDNVDKDETETYKINGVGVSVIGKGKDSTTNIFSMTVGQYQTGTTTPQSFTGIASNSDVWVQFAVKGGASSNVGVSLDGQLYKNLATANASTDGTVTFGVTDTTPFITLGTGNFALAATDGTLYNLENNASATLAFEASKNYLIDLDGSGTTFAPMTFTIGTGGSATFVSGSSDVKIFGGLAGTLAFSSETSIALGLNGTDASKQLLFTTGSSDASIGFTYNNTNVTLAGIFSSVAASDAKTQPLGYAFTLSDTTFAKLGTISVSDTSNTAVSQVIFGASSDTVTLGGAMSISTSVMLVPLVT